MKIRKIIGDGNEQLIGGNFLNDTSGSYSSLSSFKLETNFTGKINTNYDNILTSFSNPISLESINLKESDSELILTNKRVELNFDKSDLKSYIRFGSVVDYMKSAIHNIILDYPASLYIDSEEYKLTPLNTINDYIPNIYLNKSNFKINSNYIINKFGLIYNKDNLNIPDDIELRNLNLSYQDYVVYYNGGEYDILNFIGSYNGFINIEVEGLPFGEETLLLTNKTFHIKPKPIIFNKIRKNFGKLENYFLQNRLSDNSGFEIIIKEPFLMDDGRITYQDRKLLWTTTDGYNVDYEGGNFNSFVESLINISNNYDNTKTDLINRFLTPPSLKIYDNTQEKKIEKLLRIWGRNFDEVKQYIDALTKINKLSYDKKNNIPDVLVKNLARSFGWDDITLVKDDELINNFFAVDYEEKPTDFLPVEIDIELWRRILINTNFFWKTKGTRQAILAIFKLIGIPEPFVNIKEYIYTVDEVINPDDVDLSLEDLYSSSLPYNKDGNPITPIETNNFFFQISGDTDNGQHYMNNFRDVGFVLNQIEDNKKSWVYSGETIREHGSTVQYYQESSDLVLNTKQVDISLDIANAVEYDIFDYIKNVDYPNNSPDYAKKFTFININTDFETSGNTYELPEEPIGDIQISLNGITLRNGINNDYYIDENNNKIIHLNGSIETNDIILISYLFKQNNGENSELLTQTIKYVVAQAISNNDGSMIILPEEPNGDIQLTMNGISLSRSGDNFIGDYSINPNDTKQFFINNDTLKDMILNNNNIVQLSYLTSESGYDLNQRSEFYKINNFNSTKLYFDTQINRFVYVLNLKVNNINDIRFTLNGITLSPEKEYQLSTIDERNILLPPQIQIGDILGFYYVTSESGINDLTVPDSFGVGDISNLSFLEFVDLLEKKLINVKNRKVITDNKGGFYPTLLRVYIQYLKRGELEDDNILQSNGYTYDNLYEFLNKYNSFFYNFTKKLLPATVIYGKSGFMIRNSVFSKQKFTYKRGVSFNIVNGVGVPNNDLEWLGTDGSEFKVLQSGGETVPTLDSSSFVFTINTTLGTGTSFDLPLRSGYNYDFVVDWGDGNTNTITSYNQAEKLHTYSTGGEYQISITGLCESWYFNDAGDKLKITSIDQWGNTGFVDMTYAFYGCSNLISINDTDGTWCSSVTSMYHMFAGCLSLTTLNVSNWDVSNVIYMQAMFGICSSLTTLDVSNWDVSNVTNMNAMFRYCESLTTLDVSNWDVSNVTNMNAMFSECESLEILNVSNWDVSNVTNMYGMFGLCTSLTTLDVSDWNVSNVTIMRGMFGVCTSLTTLDVSDWNVSNVNDMGQMFSNTPLDTTSYDALLIGWSGLPTLQSNVELGANFAKYSSGAATTARGILTSAPNNWTITDAGQVV